MLQISTLRRQGRTLYPTVPENAEEEAQSLFVQEVGGVLFVLFCFVFFYLCIANT